MELWSIDPLMNVLSGAEWLFRVVAGNPCLVGAACIVHRDPQTGPSKEKDQDDKLWLILRTHVQYML